MSATTPRQIFIGDVHGHYNGLMQLLEAIAPGLEDRVYFVGDLIDRGPDSAQVISFVKKSAYQCVRGNHEQMLIDIFPDGSMQQPALQSWLYSGGQTTLASYKEDIDLLTEHFHWLKTLPIYLDLGDIWLAHAGVHPGLSPVEQTAQELCWIREPFHSMEQPYFPNKLIVTGHTITFTFPGVEPGKIVRGRGWLDIDTGAYHPKSGWLTGLDLANTLVYQVNVFDGELRILPLEIAATEIEPSEIGDRRHAYSR